MTDSKAPDHESIFLQPFAGDFGEHTWCSERIENEDIEYVRLDVHDAALLSAYERGRRDAVEAFPDEIDLYQMLKRAGLRKRADVAKFVARAIEGERQ